jgi:hypothetical protein
MDLIRFIFACFGIFTNTIYSHHLLHFRFKVFTQIHFFADDTTGLGKGYVLQDVINYVNVELQKMANWFRANKMCLNASKTKYIIFRTHNKPVDPLACNVVYNCTEIGLPNDPNLTTPMERISFDNTESSLKLLGVLFDEFLSFKSSLGRYVFGSEISYNKAPPRLPGLGC